MHKSHATFPASAFALIVLVVCSQPPHLRAQSQIEKTVQPPASGPDEGALQRLSVSPNPFSPGYSPKQKDTAAIGFELSRELPLHLRIFAMPAPAEPAGQPPENLVRSVPPPALQRHIGWDPNRFVWDGVRENVNREADQAAREFLPDGNYTIEAFTSARFNWRYGDPSNRPPGVIYRPHAIAVDPNSKQLYLSGTQFRIDVFASDGSFVRSLQLQPQTDKRLRGLIQAMAFQPDSTSARLLLLLESVVAEVNLSDGALRVVAALPNAQPKVQTDWLDGLAVDRSGKIYVGCAAASKIFVFESNGQLLRTIGSPGTALGQFTNLGDLAAGPDGKLYVTDSPGKAGRIQIFDANGKPLSVIQTVYDQGPLPLASPRALTVLDDGSLIVAEGAGGPLPNAGELKAFAKIDSQGKLVAAWGQRGSREDEVCFVSRMTTANGEVYFSDHYGNHRVMRVDAAGKLQQTYQTPAGVILRPLGIVPLSKEEYLVVDGDLLRCTRFTREGKLSGSWRFWDRFGGSVPDGPTGVWTADGKVFLLHADQLLALDSNGSVLQRIKLDALPVCTSRPPGLFVDSRQRIFATGSITDAVPTSNLPELGKLLVFDSQGKRLWTIGATDGGILFGSIAPIRQTNLLPAKDMRLSVQVARKDESGKLRLGVCEIRFKEDTEPELVRTVWLDDSHGNHLLPEWPFATSASGELLLKGGHHLVGFTGQGELAWTLGGMQEKSYQPAALLVDGDDVLTVDGRTGHVESWNVNAWRREASQTVEIDNTPPRVLLSGTEALVTSGDELFSLSGTAGDKNFSHYRVYWRAAGTTRGGKPHQWVTVQNEDFTTAVEAGLLAQWKIPTAIRDRGIEVKVVAWDTAGNTNESLPNEIAFDDDGDGLSNGVELSLNTDPRQKTEFAGTDAVQIEVDMQSLIRPYFFNQFEHELRYTAYDVRDPKNPIRLEGAEFTVYAQAGTFKGGTTVQPESNWLPPQPDQPESSPDSSPWSKTEAVKGLVKWTTPEAQEGAAKTIFMRAEFPKQGVNNVLYEQVVLERTLEVVRDNDRDWIPDEREVAADSPLQTTGTKDSSDSDGDGVPDGFDLAPRTSYASDMDWSSLYAPGMIRYTEEMVFYGLGGSKSEVFKYGDKLSNKNIMYSDRIRKQDKIKDYLNDVVFARNDENPLKRKRLAVVGWDHYAPFAPEDEELISDETYTGEGHPDCRFVYYALEAYGAPIIENPDVIDGRSWNEAGINRNYLKTSASGMLDEFDRKLTIQWKVLGRDQTTSDEQSQSFTRMGWLVEVFDNEDRKGEHLRFSGLAIMNDDLGEHIYEASLDIPSEQLFRNQALHIKLTPCWISRNGRPLKCPHCKLQAEGSPDVCPTSYCLAPLNRYSFAAVDRSNLSVSAVLVDTPVENIEWIQRIKPRTGSEPIAPETLDKLTDAAEQTFRNESFWPLTNHAVVKDITVEGQNFAVLFVSTRAMNQFPKNMTTDQKAARLAELAEFATGRLSTVDVVCLIANDPRKMQDLISRINWGSDGTWMDIQPGLRGTDNPPAEQIGPLGTEATQVQEKTDPSSVAESMKKVLGLYRLGKSTIRTWKQNAKFQTAPAIRNLADGESLTAAELLNQAYKDPYSKLTLKANRTITVQKCYDEPKYRVDSRATVDRPWTVWKDPKTGITITDYSVEDYFILHRTEKVSDPTQSKLILQGPEVAGTSVANNKTFWSRNAPYLNGGYTVMTNGLQVYTCLSRGEAMGVTVFTLKGTAELLQVVAHAKGAEGWVVNGLKISKTSAARLNVVALATGLLEAWYYLYKADSAPNPIEESLYIEKSLGSAFNAGLGAVEPFGGAILGGWMLGGMLGNAISDLAGLGNNESAAQIASSPGQALVVLPLHWLPESLDAGTAKMAAGDAQKKAIEKIEAHNRPWNRKRTYVWIPPN